MDSSTVQQPVPSKPLLTSGKVVLCGATDWSIIGRKPKKTDQDNEQDTIKPNLASPHFLRAVFDVNFKKIITSPTSCHSILISTNNDVYVFGRNEKGQLGLGDTNVRYEPILLTTCEESRKALKGEKIVTGATGRNHSILVAESGAVFAAGDNKSGQLGIAELRENAVFTRVTLLGKEKIKIVACGGEFTIVANDKGKLLAFGSQENGQLGNGTDGKYFKSAGQLSSAPQPYPIPIKPFSQNPITALACGTSHCLALDSEGYIYSWGFGGYGRLGHNSPKDLQYPLLIQAFSSYDEINRVASIACGQTCSMALDRRGSLWLWGKWKQSGDGGAGAGWTYPKSLADLNGWKLKAISAGATSLFAIPKTEKTTIAWGQGCQYGELGYGEGATRSSTRPEKVEPLEGYNVLDVACGVGHTLLLVVPPKGPESEEVYEIGKWPEAEDKGDACVKCKTTDDEDKLLICDKCDAPVHMYCAIPTIETVPEDDWFCDSCHPPPGAIGTGAGVEENGEGDEDPDIDGPKKRNRSDSKGSIGIFEKEPAGKKRK